MKTVLANINQKPNDELLKKVLKRSFQYFKSIRDRTKNHKQKWEFLNQNIGWILKIDSRNRNLFYILALHGSFFVGFSDKESDIELELKDHLNTEIASEIDYIQQYFSYDPYFHIANNRIVKTRVDLTNICLVLNLMNRL